MYTYYIAIIASYNLGYTHSRPLPFLEFKSELFIWKYPEKLSQRVILITLFYSVYFFIICKFQQKDWTTLIGLSPSVDRTLYIKI